MEKEKGVTGEGGQVVSEIGYINNLMRRFCMCRVQNTFYKMCVCTQNVMHLLTYINPHQCIRCITPAASRRRYVWKRYERVTELPGTNDLWLEDMFCEPRQSAQVRHV